MSLESLDPVEQIEVSQLRVGEVSALRAMTTLFGRAFDDAEAYSSAPPSDVYLQGLLQGDSFLALVSRKNGEIVGGIAAYELQKLEAQRSEVYLYDLAVSEGHRRQGIATALIDALRQVAFERGAQGIFVQADTSPEDKPAMALYRKYGEGQAVWHFDIPAGVERSEEQRSK
jgi:aminoglycoside 3-N-acetyltransferase I